MQKEVLYKNGNGHGSGVASTVAGKFCGVAKKTSLIIVKAAEDLSSFIYAITEAGKEAGTVGFLASLSPKLPIMVVVSTDDYGIQLPTSFRGHWVTVSAPGQVLCASNESGGQFQI